MSNELLSALFFAVSMVVPNLLLMALGFFLKRSGKFTDEFVQIGSNLVFTYCLPCLLFFSLSKTHVDIGQQINLLTAGLLTTFIIFFAAEIYAYFFIKEKADQGVFVQGTFRSNMAILGLACIANAYGESGVGIGAIFMGVVTIVYNILSVISLSRTQIQSGSTKDKIISILKNMATNPLIIALVAGFTYRALNVDMIPSSIEKTGQLLGATALPLALLCAGASINLKSMLQPTGLSMQASLVRIFIAPSLAVLIGYLFHLKPIEMGVLFIMMASPMAASAYVMAKSMGGNATLAANILGFTTIFSMIGMGIGAMMLRTMGLM